MIKKFSDHVFVCGANEILDKESLKNMGVTAVLNVAFEVNDPAYEDFLMTKVGLTDDRFNTEDQKAMAVDTLKTLLDQGKTVMVHCMAGASRSPYIAARALCEIEGCGIDTIYDQVIAQYGEGQAFRHSPLRTNSYTPIGA